MKSVVKDRKSTDETWKPKVSSFLKHGIIEADLQTTAVVVDFVRVYRLLARGSNKFH